MPGMLLKATQYLISAFKVILILSQGLADDNLSSRFVILSVAKNPYPPLPLCPPLLRGEGEEKRRGADTPLKHPTGKKGVLRREVITCQPNAKGT
jgi:hypothetical protein